MNIALMLDITILVALAVTIGYAVRLSRQLTNLRGDQAAIQKLIDDLSGAITRADIAIQNMRETAETSGDDLQNTINNAREIFSELEIMVEAGDSLAERLGALAEDSRKTVQKSPKKEAEDKESNIVPKTRAEQELLEAIKQEAGS